MHNIIRSCPQTPRTPLGLQTAACVLINAHYLCAACWRCYSLNKLILSGWLGCNVLFETLRTRAHPPSTPSFAWSWGNCPPLSLDDHTGSADRSRRLQGSQKHSSGAQSVNAPFSSLRLEILCTDPRSTSKVLGQSAVGSCSHRTRVLQTLFWKTPHWYIWSFSLPLKKTAFGCKFLFYSVRKRLFLSFAGYLLERSGEILSGSEDDF